MNTAKTVFGIVEPGDLVISTGKSAYSYLIGTVTAIDKLGTPGHKTENSADDVHIDFTAFDYSPERIADIEAYFSDLYGREMKLGDVPLDDVVMAPKTLISLSHVGEAEITRMANSRQSCEAFCNAFPSAVIPENEKHAALIARAEGNLDAYHDLLMGFGGRELIDMAEKISAMTDAYSYICYNGFSEEAMDFLLRFENPLEVVADGWLEYDRASGVEMGYAMDAVLEEKEDWLAAYPLATDPAQPEAPLPRRFMEVGIQDFFDAFSERANARNPEGWSEAGNKVWDMALSDDQYDKRLLLLMGEKGCAILNERDVLVQDSVPLGVVADYASDPGASAYFVVAGTMHGRKERVDLFEVASLSDYVKHAREAALPCHLVVLAYGNGNTLQIEPDVYHQSPDSFDTHEGRELQYVWYVPNNMREMDRLMDAEISRRVQYPEGDLGDFFKSVERTTDKAPPSLETPPAPDKKPSIADKLRAGKEKSDANRAQNPAATTKKQEKEIGE